MVFETLSKEAISERVRWSARTISTLPTKVVTSLSNDSAESPSITSGELKRKGSSTAKS